MQFILLLLWITQVFSASLEQTSFITLRSTNPPPGGGNLAPVIYRELVMEEWKSNPVQLIQTWNVPCSLPGLSAETWTEGRLSPRYPYEDQVWFLCRNVPVNSSLNYSPAPVRYMVLNEEGSLNTCVEDFVYPNGTNLVNILPYQDQSQGINVYYLLGGGSTGLGSKPAQPRIRVDSTLCGPADTEGALLAYPQGVTIHQLRILGNTLYGTGLFGSASGGLPSPMIYQIGAEGVLPSGTRIPTANIPDFPLVLSVWTDPFSGVWWRTGFNKTAYLAKHNNSDNTDLVFALPPSSSGGTLGGSTWSILTARQEGTDFAVYLTNSTSIMKNTLNGLQNGLPYQPFLQAPSGWRYLSAHARNLNFPTPSATATATSSASASATATATSSSSTSATSTSSASATATATATSTSQPTSTSSSSVSASASASSYPTSTTRNPQISADPSPSHSPSSSPSNGTIPISPDNNQAANSPLSPGEQAGIGLGSIAALCVAGLLMMKFTPSLRNLWTQQFGSSSKGMKKGVSFRSPVVSSDVPITISHNPHVLVQHRLEQLKDLQKQLSTREVNQTSEKSLMDRTKKEFGPVITGEHV